MVSLVHRQIAGHEVVELETAEAYRLYDRLVLREAKGRIFHNGRGYSIVREQDLAGALEKRAAYEEGLPRARR